MNAAGRRHAQRHLLAGRAAVRAADRHDAAGAAAAAGGGLRRDSPRLIREEEPPQAEHAAEHVRARRWPAISAQRQTEPAQAGASWCAASWTGS